MPLLKKLKKKLHYFLLHRKISKQGRTHKSLNIFEAKSISILFDADDKSDVDKILNWADTLRREGKEVQLLAYMPHKLKDYNPPYPYFTKKAINWLYFPNNEQIDQFMGKRSDILCCLFTQENLTLEAIAALSNAQFRVGKFHEDKTYCFDFMINVKNKSSSRELLEQVNHFLTQIRSTNAAI